MTDNVVFASFVASGTLRFAKMTTSDGSTLKEISGDDLIQLFGNGLYDL